MTENNNNIMISNQANPMGLSGEGEITGEKYQGTGITKTIETFAIDELPYEMTYVNNFRIIGKTGNNLLFQETFHITVNANGEITAELDNIKSECY